MSVIARLPLFALLSVLAVASFESPARAESKKDAPAPKDVTLETKDGVKLVCTYYQSTAGKDATPVVMLGDLKDSRAVFDELARRMQGPGDEDQHPSFAVLTVDLRGHGDSTKQVARNGASRELDAAKLGREDLTAMVTMDMEAVRKFLVEKNDAGELNINRLSIVGSGLGASVAVNWAAVDWSAPPLAVGKQGQDVKALVLISPEWSYKGLQMNNALRHPGLREKVGFFIMYGAEDRSHTADAKRIEKQLERYHPEPDSLPEGEPHSLALIGPNTKLQATKFLTEAGADAQNAIIKFLMVHVVKEDYEWTARKRT